MRLLILPLLIAILSTFSGYGVEIRLDYKAMRAAANAHGKKMKNFRNYNRPVEKSEKEIVSYLILKMGNSPLLQLWSKSDDLERAGDKIDHLHPLRFLMCIFTDESMKAAMGNLKKRDLVWGRFKKGLFESLKDETENDNMHHEYIVDFAKTLHIDVNLIIRPLQQQRWEEFVTLLIKHVPREGDPKRYDM